ncbi:MAG: universal stress protein [Flavipsychrobacter sp.]|nr:universal stress protein [Flavipsychrobacter sp.]
MSTIIAATDFSSIGENAVRYACQLAKQHNASLVVVHSFIIPIAFSETPMPVMPIDESRDIAEDRMKKELNELKRAFPEVNMVGKIMYGDIVDCLKEYIEEEGAPWLIVLGNSGTGEEASLWLGSTALSALKNLDHPVITIPAGCSYTEVKKICFACDYKHVTGHLPTQHLLELVNNTGAELHVLNIDHNDQGVTPDTPLETEELRNYLAPAHPQYHFVDSSNTDEAINAFVEQNQMDWLVVIPHKHSFFEGLFHKSHVKAMVRMSHVPIVALHEA